MVDWVILNLSCLCLPLFGIVFVVAGGLGHPQYSMSLLASIWPCLCGGGEVVWVMLVLSLCAFA